MSTILKVFITNNCNNKVVKINSKEFISTPGGGFRCNVPISIVCCLLEIKSLNNTILLVLVYTRPLIILVETIERALKYKSILTTMRIHQHHQETP
jgi:hypothetical protein